MFILPILFSSTTGSLTKQLFCEGNISIKLKFMKVLTQRGMITPKHGEQTP